jgi:hypothetical protein
MAHKQKGQLTTTIEWARHLKKKWDNQKSNKWILN